VGQVTARAVPDAEDPPSRPTRWSLSPRQRKLVLAAHVILSVGLLGISTALLVLATVAAATSDAATAQAAYRSLGIFTRGVVQPVAIGALVSGLVLSLGTAWGLVRHVWIVTKLALTAAVILCGMLVVGPSVKQAIAMTSGAAPPAGADLGSLPVVLVAASGVNVILLGAATVLSVYKPRGTLGRARRE
jgi:hypothetical protein